MDYTNTFDFVKVHIGELVSARMEEIGMNSAVLAEKLKKSESFVEKIIVCKSLDADLILRLSKILKYDFFRVYSQHLLLYCPPANLFGGNGNFKAPKGIGKVMPKFIKNVYTPEIIAFVLSKIATGTMTHLQVMTTYRIPKTTLYKWCRKYGVTKMNDSNKQKGI